MPTRTPVRGATATSGGPELQVARTSRGTPTAPARIDLDLAELVATEHGAAFLDACSKPGASIAGEPLLANVRAIVVGAFQAGQVDGHRQGFADAERLRAEMRATIKALCEEYGYPPALAVRLEVVEED